MTPRKSFTDVSFTLPPRDGQYPLPSTKIRPEQVTRARQLLKDPEYPGLNIRRSIAYALIQSQ